MSKVAAAKAHTSLSRRSIWRAVALGVVVLLAGAVVPLSASAQTDENDAQQAAREIQDARDRANAASVAYFNAQSDLEVLQDDLKRLELESVQLTATVDRLRQDVEAVAVARFVSSGATGIPLLTGIQAPQDQVQAEVFVDVLTNTSTDVLDQYDIADKLLKANEVELDERQHDIERQQVVFSQLQQQAEDEVVLLRATEEERLQDEAVVRALEAQLAAERTRLEDEARREAEAAARAIPDPSEGLPAPTTTVLLPDGEEPPSDGEETPPDDSTVVVAPIPVLPTATLPPSNSGASGGTSGGRTGTGGAGSNPRPIDTGGGYVDVISCPIPGSAYGDTWGAPRSGGRRHEGVDMLAPRGAPIYAVTTGFVTFKTNALGGNAASLVGNNGNRYYYAHFDSYEGGSRAVIEGDLIAYNGDSGNARGTPHLHFEVHPGGGLAVNPTPSVRAAGC